jgi:hypothetical protein
MANTRFNQFLYTKHGKPVHLDVKIPIGATGAVGTLVGGAGISSVTRNAAGIYQINLIDSYNKFLGMDYTIASPNSGSSILVASAGTTSGTTYVITILGTTTTAGWQTLGLPVGITPAVGVAFKATATTTATGTGAVQVQAAAGSTLASLEVLGDPTTTINVTGIGAANPYIILQTLAATASGTTTLVATDPASGSSLYLDIYLSDASNSAKDNG